MLSPARDMKACMERGEGCDKGVGYNTCKDSAWDGKKEANSSTGMLRVAFPVAASCPSLFAVRV